MRTKQDHLRLLNKIIDQVLKTETSYHLKCPPYYKFTTFRSEFFTLAQEHPRREEFTLSARRGKNILIISPKLPDTSLISVSPESSLSQTYSCLTAMIPPREDEFLQFSIVLDFPSFKQALDKEKAEQELLGQSINEEFVLLIYLLFHRNKFLPSFLDLSTNHSNSIPSPFSDDDKDEWEDLPSSSSFKEPG